MKKINKILLPFVITATLITSCVQDTTSAAVKKVLEDVSKASTTLPKIDKGAVSGSVFDKTLSTSNDNTEAVVKVIRAEEIYKLDTNGNPEKDPKTKQDIVIEKKGQVLQTLKLKEKSQFLITDLLPGAISVLVTKRQENVQADTVIEAGKTTQVKQFIFGEQQKEDITVITSINVSGKVVYVDGKPVVGAKVSDVTGGFINTSTVTDENGKFTLIENPFTKARNLDISLGDSNASGSLFTSYSVTPDKTEDITVPLLANSRFLSGRVLDSVLKSKPVEGLLVKVEGTNISGSTDVNGFFRLKGVPLSSVSISIGGVKGFIDKRIDVEPAQTNDEKKLGDTFITPLGNVLVNLAAESSKFINSSHDGYESFSYIGYDSALLDSNNKPRGCYMGDGTTPLNNYRLLGNGCYYENGYVYKEAIQGSVKFEGTNISVPFTYPITPTREVKYSIVDSVGLITQQTETLFSSNQRFSIPVSDIPGGEYTVSISLAHHETQKGVKLIVPSNDITSTELIQMKLAKSVLGMGDIRGKIIVKDSSGNVVSTPSNIVVAALKSSDEVLTPSRVQQLLTDSNNSITYSLANVSSDGTYNLQNVQSGTRIIVAGVITNGILDSSLIPNTYVLVNVSNGIINNASDIIMIRR